MTLLSYWGLRVNSTTKLPGQSFPHLMMLLANEFIALTDFSIDSTVD